MADEVVTRIEITGDSRDATDALLDVETAAKDAEDAVDELSSTDVDVDTSNAVDELGKVDAASDDAQAALRSIGDADITADTTDARSEIDKLRETAEAVAKERYEVEIDVDQDKVRGAAESVKQIGVNAEGLQRGIGPLRGFTDELGDSAGKAGVFANAFIDAGEAVEVFGSQLGVSEKTLGKISTGLGIAGAAIGVATLAWSRYRDAQTEAREETEKLIALQDLLAQGKAAEAAEQFVTDYEGAIRKLDEFGVKAGDVYRFVTGEIDKLAGSKPFPKLTTDPAGLQEYDDFRKTLEDLSAARDRFQTGASQDSQTKRWIDEITTAAGGLDTTVASLPKSWSAAWQGAIEFGEKAGGALDDTSESVRELVEHVDEIPEVLRQAADSNSWLSLQDAFDDVKEKGAAAMEAARTGAADAEQKMRDYERSVNDATTAVYNYATEVLGLDTDVATRLSIEWQTDPAAVEAELDKLTKDRELFIKLTPIWVGTGGRIPREDFLPSSATTSSVQSAPAPTSSIQSVPAVGTMNVYMPPGADGADVISAAQRWMQLDGRQSF